MTDAALTSVSTYAQVRVREPIGDRTLGETPTIGGEGSDIVIPGVGPGPTLQIERRKGVWIVSSAKESGVRFDGRPLAGLRDLRRYDVLAVGDAQIIVTGVSRTLLRLEVCHLVGNTTISPAGAVSQIAHDDGDEELLIRAPPPPAPKLPEPDRSARLRARVARTLSFITLPRTRQFRPVPDRAANRHRRHGCGVHYRDAPFAAQLCETGCRTDRRANTGAWHMARDSHPRQCPPVTR